MLLLDAIRNHHVDVAALKAYSSVGQSIAKMNSLDTFPALSMCLREVHYLFRSLAGGIDNQRSRTCMTLWRAFKPSTPTTMEQLEGTLAFEDQVQHFDDVCRSFELPLDQLAELRVSFSRALQLAHEGVNGSRELSQKIQNLISESEGQDSDLNSLRSPHFCQSFRKLHEHFAILSLSKKRLAPLQMAELELLALRKTRISISSDSRPTEGGIQDQFRILETFVAPFEEKSHDATSVDDRGDSLLEQMTTVQDVGLSQLGLLESEVRALGRTISSQAHLLSDSGLCSLDLCLRALVSKALDALQGVDDHQELQHSATRLLASLNQPVHSMAQNDISRATVGSINGTDSIHNFAMSHLEGVVTYLQSQHIVGQDRILAAANAWAFFSIACLQLYIPETAFDPALDSRLRRNVYFRSFNDLSCRMEALHLFRSALTGQKDSLRAKSLQEDISGLGEEPLIDPICRPEVSQLSQLQFDLDGLRRILQPLWQTDRHNSPILLLDATLLLNLVRSRDRLSKQYRAYDDFTVPIIGFINSLLIAQRLHSFAIQQKPLSQELAQVTPFVGATFESWLDGKSFIDVGETLRTTSEILCWLGAVRVRLGTSSSKKLDSDLRNAVERRFHEYYLQWKSELEQDRGKNARKSNVYKFVQQDLGSDESTVEEMEELFPNHEYAAESTSTRSAVTPAREVASSLAALHLGIFLPHSVDRDSMINLLRQWLRIGLKDWKVDENMIPANVLALGDLSSSLSASDQKSRPYNIYTDPNISEVKKLVELIKRTVKQFQELQRVWPEHATPTEVLRQCFDLLEVRYSAPLSMLLPRVEKIYAAVNEWQTIASRQYSASEVFEALSSLIVGWRRLELSSWAGLFDRKWEQCQREAASWWYIAYESIIVAASGLGEDSNERLQHTVELLRALGEFVTSSGLGEFNARLQMLRGFEGHLLANETDHPSFGTIRVALANFNRYFAQFEEPVIQRLSEGRNQLEKEVKDIIQLASWKDRNIEVLRQSAQSSHKKLLRAVRKYRALLSQPVAPLIEAGITRKHNGLSDDLLYDAAPTSDENGSTQMTLPTLPAWNDAPSRIRNAIASAGLISKKLHLVRAEFTGARQLKSFRDELEASISELRKSTPSVLTEENKSFVNHLKTRKRRLLADVLKDIRHMGFRTAVGEQDLHRQSSLYAIFGQLPDPSKGGNKLGITFAQQELFQLLHLMPVARERSRRHSEDLTPAEVVRCISLMESVLQVSLSQNRFWSLQMVKLEELEANVSQIVNFGACDAPHVLDEDTKRRLACGDASSCLHQALQLALELLRAQGSLSQSDYSMALSTFERLQSEIGTVQDSAKTLPDLPKNVQSTDNAKLQTRWMALVNELRSNVEHFSEAQPETGPILVQILKWTNNEPFQITQSHANGILTSGPNDYVRDICETLDYIFASVQAAEGVVAKAKSVDARVPIVKQQAILENVLKALRITSVTHRISRLNSGLQHVTLDQEASSLTALATVYRFTSPIFEAYQVSVTHFLASYRSLCVDTSSLGSTLANSFIQVASHGFCSPSEKTQDSEGQVEGAEYGTGLGEGEGTEDISKEIGGNEDLSEIAQEPNGETEQGLQDEKNAVDMADEEMEGDVGEPPSAPDTQDGDDDADTQETGELDPEPGEDDLGPNSVDEKMWDRAKDQLGDKEAESRKGAPAPEDMAAGAADKTENDSGNLSDEVGVESEAVTGEEIEQKMEDMDPHVKDESNLDLPEDMEVDGKPGDMNDESDSDFLSDGLESEAEHDPRFGADEDGDANVDEDYEDQGREQEMNEKQAARSETENEEEPSTDDDSEMLQQSTKLDEVTSDPVFGEDGDGPEKNEGAGGHSQARTDFQNGQESNSPEQSNEDVGGGSERAAQQGDPSSQELGQETEVEHQHRLPYKTLGDVLEQWYDRHRRIEDARQPDEASREEVSDLDRANFEHLPNDAIASDAQALGAASAEDSKPLNEDNGLGTDDTKDTKMVDERPDERSEQLDHETQADQMHIDPTESFDQKTQQPSFIGEPRNAREDEGPITSETLDKEHEEEDEVHERLINTHISVDDSEAQLSFDDARQRWMQHESSTRNLALILTEHLRLILQPTQATKMRGDFRTGKRLNIKRIIPYIASSYKRDKIWMRRSVPSKRSYQIMLAIDDSKSMMESRSNELAFETLTLMAKSLSMLEVGELSVVSFGEHVKIAHDFSTSFTAEAGAQTLQHFTFTQAGTNVQRLLVESIELFRNARSKTAGSSRELWQLQLIISDGICEDHHSVRRLVRQAYEERIMIVFIVVDAAKQSGGGEAGTKQSILDLQTAEFVNDASGEMQLKMTKYLDTFPFHYYLIVRDVQELPGILAGALRQWFAEVVDAGD